MNNERFTLVFIGAATALMLLFVAAFIDTRIHLDWLALICIGLASGFILGFLLDKGP